MRSKKALLNTIFSLLLELITIISGLIVPRLILTYFGSSYNGIMISISQFLTVIALLRSGAGGVTRAALYKPLAQKDVKKISAILRATEIFMRKIAIIFLAGIIVFACIYPLLVTEFSWLFTFTLIIILGIDSLFNYYFGITYQILLMADQREYIYSIIRIVTTIVTTIISALLILFGCEIYVVKLGAALSCLISPLGLHIYVRKRYSIERNIEPEYVAIKQRWNAFIHQIANYIHSNTDVMVLTFFAGDIKVVSVYAVYSMVISKIKTIIKSFTNGIEAALGNMLANNEDKSLHRNFRLIECLAYLSSDFFFGCTGSLIISFVSVYTRGVTDVNYYRPIFALLFTFAEFIYCVRIPYISLIQSAGHYKQTQNGAIIEAVINLTISIVLVFKCGLIGVAIGTFVAMLYRTIYLMIYAYKKILKTETRSMWLQLLMNFCCTVLIISISLLTIKDCTNYVEWLVNAIIVCGISLFFIGVIALALYKDDCMSIVMHLKQIHKKSNILNI